MTRAIFNEMEQEKMQAFTRETNSRVTLVVLHANMSVKRFLQENLQCTLEENKEIFCFSIV